MLRGSLDCSAFFVLALPCCADEEQPAAAQEQQGRTYVQEQQQLKKAFLSAFDEEAPEGAGEDAFGSGVLQQRKRKQQQKLARKAAAGSDAGSSSGEEEGDDAEEGAAGGAGAGRDGNADAARVQQLLDGYFGRDAELDPKEKFLKRYILNKVRGTGVQYSGWRYSAVPAGSRLARCSSCFLRPGAPWCCVVCVSNMCCPLPACPAGLGGGGRR